MTETAPLTIEEVEEVAKSAARRVWKIAARRTREDFDDFAQEARLVALQVREKTAKANNPRRYLSRAVYLSLLYYWRVAEHFSRKGARLSFVSLDALRNADLKTVDRAGGVYFRWQTADASRRVVYSDDKARAALARAFRLADSRASNAARLRANGARCNVSAAAMGVGLATESRAFNRFRRLFFESLELQR